MVMVMRQSQTRPLDRGGVEKQDNCRIINCCFCLPLPVQFRPNCFASSKRCWMRHRQNPQRNCENWRSTWCGSLWRPPRRTRKSMQSSSSGKRFASATKWRTITRRRRTVRTRLGPSRRRMSCGDCSRRIKRIRKMIKVKWAACRVMIIAAFLSMSSGVARSRGRGRGRRRR